MHYTMVTGHWFSYFNGLLNAHESISHNVKCDWRKEFRKFLTKALSLLKDIFICIEIEIEIITQG